MPDFILYEGDPIAVPAFRIIAIIDGDIHGERNRQILTSIYAKFEALFGESANVTSYNFPGYTGKIRWTNPKIIEDGRSFFQKESTKYGQGIRRYGYALDSFKEPALPFFGVEQRSYFNFLEIAIPEDNSSAMDFANFVTEQLMEAPVISGFMGMGFFLPPYKSSLQFMMGGTTARYRAVIDVTPDMLMEGIRKEGSAYRWKPGEQPGIGDIGWRTFVGAEFWDRLPDQTELNEALNVEIEKSDSVLCITAGEPPIWGDVNKGEDIGAYKVSARYLAPVRMPHGALEAFGFGGNGTPEHKDKIEAYLTRFD
ncbi:hypothetical protein [Agrobacterium rosae]|uniref:hypothetical protein n=1 Tax=Agrobacterium rosae TaxID=1972867 RepID=UPI003BA06BB1